MYKTAGILNGLFFLAPFLEPTTQNSMDVAELHGCSRTSNLKSATGKKNISGGSTTSVEGRAMLEVKKIIHDNLRIGGNELCFLDELISL
jgi:hypothetical protein